MAKSWKQSKCPAPNETSQMNSETTSVTVQLLKIHLFFNKVDNLLLSVRGRLQHLLGEV